ncbi:solute carrier 35 member [Beauveria asiatica]|uniref:Solute carrier 35 member n=1 Tax=Beauveria asiatica TaxID=1069075 RepID=A0AAW0RN02_9HYPO
MAVQDQPPSFEHTQVELEKGLLALESEEQHQSPLQGPAPPSNRTEFLASLHPGFFIAFWMATSSGVILFNKWVLSAADFHSRHKVPMNCETYMKSIMPMGVLFSLSLITGNLAYLYLSVSFIQMLKASNAVVTLLATWALNIASPNLKFLGNVAFIVFGVMIATFGEIQFHLLGFFFQACAIIFGTLRLVLVQRLLSHPELNMDPMVSLYYYAPACALFNGVLTAVIEAPDMRLSDFSSVGVPMLLANAFVAFLLNVSIVLLLGKTSAVALTMSAILKDILLVFASMVLFGDPVSGQQFIGYSIAMGGLIYYKIDRETMQSLAQDVTLKFNAVVERQATSRHGD